MNSAAPDGSTSADTAATGMASTDTAASGTASTDTAAAGGEGIAKDGSHMPLEDASGLWVFACYGAAGFAPFAGALLG